IKVLFTAHWERTVNVSSKIERTTLFKDNGFSIRFLDNPPRIRLLGGTLVSFGLRLQAIVNKHPDQCGHLKNWFSDMQKVLKYF
ncbi:MAG: hypothetical protein AAFR31_20810, partial [Cyanobacteria bacterium J06627_8]